jgi:hypothetical protein
MGWGELGTTAGPGSNGCHRSQDDSELWLRLSQPDFALFLGRSGAHPFLHQLLNHPSFVALAHVSVLGDALDPQYRLPQTLNFRNGGRLKHAASP